MPILAKILDNCKKIQDEIRYCDAKFQLNKILHHVNLTHDFKSLKVVINFLHGNAYGSLFFRSAVQLLDQQVSVEWILYS